MSCYYHPEREAVNTCSDCGQAVCRECNYVTGTHPICRHCWDLRVSNIKAGTRVKPLEKKKSTKEMFTPHEQPVAEEPMLYEPPTDQKPEEAVQDTWAVPQEQETFAETPPQEMLAIPVEPTGMQQPLETETPPPQPPEPEPEAKQAEPKIRNLWAEAETPVYKPAEEVFTPYRPSTPEEPGVTHEPPADQKPEEAVPDLQEARQEQDIFAATPPQEVIHLPEELTVQDTKPTDQEPETVAEPPPQEATAIPVEPTAQDTKPVDQEPETVAEAPPQETTAIPVEPTNQSPLLTHGANMLLQQPAAAQPQVEVTHVEPETTHVEPEIGNVWATTEPTIAHEEPPAAEKTTMPKAKPNTGKQIRSFFGSLSRLKPRKGKPGTADKKKPSRKPHHIKVSQQTFQCHQCGTENAIGELFCQACGTWFQYSCPTCGAIVDPSFDSCPSCNAELGWGVN